MAEEGGTVTRRPRRNSSSFKRGVHGYDDVIGGSIDRDQVTLCLCPLPLPPPL
eukprot:COSAG03_NODE_1131_length_4754_cov_2.983673_3_plen_53_part_00